MRTKIEAIVAIIVYPRQESRAELSRVLCTYSRQHCCTIQLNDRRFAKGLQVGWHPPWYSQYKRARDGSVWKVFIA